LVSTATVLALGALALAGCGSSTGSSSSSASTGAQRPAIARSDFVSKANAICAKGNAANKAAGAKLGAKPTEEQIVTFVRGIEVPAIKAQIAAIKALGAPPGDAALVKRMLGLATGAVEKVRIDPTILTTGADLFAQFARVAHPYGLTSCAPKSR
jgi:hypothetical protein